MKNDFGKVRVYRCPCGATNVKPLRPRSFACVRCGENLRAASYQIEDHKLFMDRLWKGKQ